MYIVAIFTACPSQINFLCKIYQYYLAKYNKYVRNFGFPTLSSIYLQIFSLATCSHSTGSNFHSPTTHTDNQFALLSICDLPCCPRKICAHCGTDTWGDSDRDAEINV